MYVSAVIINTIAISFPFISMIIYARLLLNIFCFKTIRRTSDLSLFYCKFGFDLVISVISFLKLIVYGLAMTSLKDFIFLNHWLTFMVVWPINLLTAMRAMLLLFIATDRTFATYLPIKFFKYRKYIPTYFIVSIVLFYPIIDSLVMFGYCRPDISAPTTCVSALCALGTCYHGYSMRFQQICYSMILTLCVLLAIKLFIWNKYRDQSACGDLRKANRLALIDCCIIVTFDLIPPLMQSVIPDLFIYVGAINSVGQTLGFVVESCLVTINLKQKYQTKTITSTGNIVVRSGGVDTSVLH